MAGFTNLAETDFLDLFFTNVDFPNVGDAAGLQASLGEGSLYVSGHLTDSLTDASTLQTDTECTYTGYARVGVARNVANWTVTGDTVDNDNLLQLGEMTAGGPVTITDCGLGFAASGAGVLQIWGQVTIDLIVNNNVNPQYAAGALDVTSD
ncbi:hypothetical protein LCGC14_0491520 [marine sediment metagenome]|uniref:Uncharacterized protein n=1 Tax=marine sediment metagenome TaxID=412755 RepID=A0A0F9SBN6_9ZZZZ